MTSLLNKFDDKYIIQKEDVLEIVSFYLKSNDLSNFLKDIIFDDESKFLAFYDIKENSIVLNNDKILDFCKKNTDQVKTDYHVSDEYSSYFINFYYMEAVFHELIHAVQKMKYDKANSNSLYAYLYDLCRLLDLTDISFYEKNHDLLPMEIEANNKGFFKAYQLMTYTKLPGKEAQVMHLEYLSNLLKHYRKLNNYKVLAPLDKLHIKNEVVDIEEIYRLMDKENLSKMDRLNFGLDITPKEYDSIDKEKRKILLRR